MIYARLGCLVGLTMGIVGRKTAKEWPSLKIRGHTDRDQDNILADEQHKQFLYLGVWAPWITILSMEY